MSEVSIVDENESTEVSVGGGVLRTNGTGISCASNPPDSATEGVQINDNPEYNISSISLKENTCDGQVRVKKEVEIKNHARSISSINDTKCMLPQIQTSSASWATTKRQDMAWGYWYQPDISDTRIRSKTYATSRVKVPNGAPPLLELTHFDFLKKKGRVDDVGSHKNSWLNRACPSELKGRKFLIINIQITAMSVMLVQYFVFNENGSTGCERVDKIWNEFVQGSDKARDHRLKLIPSIVKGNYLVRKSVPTRPCIIGTKVKSRYFEGTNYFEVDIETDASIIAKGVLSLLKGYTNWSVDLVWILEAVTLEELPERILAAMHLGYPDYKKAVSLENPSK